MPGLLIVVIAIMLDRTTTAASERRERAHPGPAGRSGPGSSRAARPRRLPSLLGGRSRSAVVLVCIYLSRTYLRLAAVPDLAERRPTAGRLGSTRSPTGVVDHVDTYTEAFKNFITYGFLNPLQSLLAEPPWWLMAPVLLAISFVLGGLKPLLATALCEAVILGVGPVERRDDHADLDPGRDRAGDDPRDRARGLDRAAADERTRSSGPSSTPSRRSRRSSTWSRRWPCSDPPGSPPSSAAVAYAVPDRGQAGRRRDPRRLRHDRRGRAGQRHHALADDHQGPAADGALRDRAGRQPGTALRAVDGGHRRPGRRPAASATSWSPASRRTHLFGKGLAAGIAVTALGIMLDRIAARAAGAPDGTPDPDHDPPSRREGRSNKEGRTHGTTTTPAAWLASVSQPRWHSA